MLKIVFGIITVLFALHGWSQDLPMGGWRTHLPFAQAQCLEPVGTKIFVGTKGGLFSYDSTDNDLEIFTSVNGLSDQDIRSLSYNTDQQTLVIGYASGNIDLLKNGTVKNINAIVSKNIPVNKSINHILQRGNRAYLATGFGIVEVDLILGEIKNTYLIGSGSKYVGCYQLASDGSRILAATDSGIFRANWAAPNLSDFQYWSLDPQWGRKKVKHLVHQQGVLFTAVADSLFSNASGGYSLLYQTPNEIRKIRADRGKLHVSIFYRILELNLQGQLLFQTGIDPQVQDVKDGIIDANQHCWLADNAVGLGYYHEYYMLRFLPNGPNSVETFDLFSEGQNTYGVSGGVTKSFGNLYLKGGIYRFDGQKWKNFNSTNLSLVSDTRDFTSVKKQPKTNKWYVSTWTRGLLEFDGDSLVRQYQDTGTALARQKNSNLGNPGGDFIRVGFMDFDKSGNLWMTNYEVPSPLVVKRTDGTWNSYPLPSGLTKAVYFLMDDFDQKWVVVPGLGIAVFNASTTQSKLLTSVAGMGNIHNATIQCITKDLDGVVWIGTPEGPTAFYNPGGVFSNNEVNAQRVKIAKNQFDNFVDYLLEDQSINDIGIDGANRKWFATNNGVWLMSSDCQTQIHHFTKENSPLLSNNVLTVSIDGKTGEVFFGTETGLCSFRGDATVGATSGSSSVKVFPNPARPELDGPISVQGLVANAWIKFVDAAGNLVYQTKANGGTVTWNGNDLQGNRVATGTYFILASDDFGSERQVGKVYLVR